MDENGSARGATSAEQLKPNAKETKMKAILSHMPIMPAWLQALFMLTAPVFFVWFCFIAIHTHQGSLVKAYQALANSGNGGVLLYIWNHIPRITAEGALIYYTWLLVQAFLYIIAPGPIGYGQRTPGGNIIKYHCNGLSCWIFCHIVLIVAVWAGWIKSTLFYDNVGCIFVLANISGLVLTLFAYIKAHLFPSHPEDRRFSGSFLYDLFMGIEHNPAIGSLDFKLFFNGRSGILAWTLINLSCAVKQYLQIGHVTNSMLIVNFLHALYVLDFFVKEDWYLRTMDIAHDHFGFYLAWGDLTWLPFMYTLQAFYLVQNPVALPWWAATGIVLLGLTGYYIFRSANSQKDEFRLAIARGETYKINGKPASFIPAAYFTTDGKKHFSPLLTSGWWGYARHFNYVGDLMISLAYCLPCGFDHILPYFYIIYMFILLVHRIYRDDVRCREKYGKYWDHYCNAVPYKLIPGIF